LPFTLVPDTGGAAVASSNNLHNNLFFGTSDFSTYFYIIQPWINGEQTIAAQFASPSLLIDDYNGQYVPANWSLTETPLPSTWTMLIAGFAGFGFFAYRGTKKFGAARSVA
jgi:hypothetical protein